MKRQHRKKEFSELKSIKSENKRLKDENRSLKKQIKQFQKHEHFHEDTRLNNEADEMLSNVEPPVPRCPECSKPGLNEFNVVGRNWIECDFCDYDSRHKK